MTALRFDYTVRRSGHTTRSRKRCSHCGRTKPLARFHKNRSMADGHSNTCKPCKREADLGYLAERQAGECTQCGRKTRGRELCEPCRERKVEGITALAQPLGPGPNVCGIPMGDGWCRQAVGNQVNRDGLAVLWCIVHGERLAPRIRPGDAGYPTDVPREQMAFRVKVAKAPRTRERNPVCGDAFRQASHKRGKGEAA